MNNGKIWLGLALIAIAAPMTVLAGGGGGGMGGGGMGGGMGGPGGGMGGGGMGGGGMGGGGMGGGGMGGGGMGGGGAMGGGGMGGGGMGGRTYTTTMTTDYVRQQVTFSDNEWAVIQPKLQKVLDALVVVQSATTRTRNAAMGGGMGGGMGGAAGGMTAATTAATAPTGDAVAQAKQELEATLGQNPAPAVDASIKTKLAALREAKIKAKEAYAKAQADLVKVLSIRQEAMLVDLAILE